MPRRDVKRGRTSRRSGKRPASRSVSGFRGKQARSLQVVARPQPHLGLAASVVTVLRTSFYAQVSSNAAGVYTGFIKPGSAFDPSGDIAAYQPAYFDQWASMYGRYMVKSADVYVKVNASSSSSTANSPGWVGAMYPAIDNTAMATYLGAASQPMAQTVSSAFTVVNGAAGTAIAPGAESVRFTFKKLSTKKLVGTTPDPYSNGALVSADPTNLQYMVMPIFLQASNAGAGQFWNLNFDIYQTVLFTQKKTVYDT